jgi:hypothetical protein
MARQAITTRYLGATNHRGSRVKAYAQAGTKTIPWDHALDPEDNHRAAAEALANDRRWLEPRAYSGVVRTPRLVAGALPSGDGYAFVFVEE